MHYDLIEIIQTYMGFALFGLIVLMAIGSFFAMILLAIAYCFCTTRNFFINKF